MKRRILMLSSTWDADYSKSVIAGIKDRMIDPELELHIFNAYDDVEEIYFYRKDREIYSLPIVDQYEGLILLFSSVDAEKFTSTISKQFAAQNKPIVSIDAHCENAIFCGLDNYRSMYQIIDHMITIHDCRTLNYVGGPEDNEEDKERFRAYSDCLKAHGITMDKSRIVHKRFLRSDGEEAYEEFREKGLHMPDAVICSNDYMALGYIEAAMNDGVKIPEYLRVTGFDNVANAQVHSPSVTSVNRNWKQLGYDAMDSLLIKMNEGSIDYSTRYTEGYVCYNESCGCEVSRDLRADYNNLLDKNKQEFHIITLQTYARQYLCAAFSMEKFQEALGTSEKILGIKNVAVCLNKSFFNENYAEEINGFDEELHMYTDLSDEIINRNDRLYPKEWEDGEENVFLFSSLHFGVKTYGYCVMPYMNNFISRVHHRTFMESVSLSLENIYQRLSLETISAKLSTD